MGAEAGRGEEPGWGSAWLGAAPVLTEARQPGPSPGLGWGSRGSWCNAGAKGERLGSCLECWAAVVARPRWAPWGIFSVGHSQLLNCLPHNPSKTWTQDFRPAVLFTSVLIFFSFPVCVRVGGGVDYCLHGLKFETSEFWVTSIKLGK